jgi:hypothetical protein
VSLSHRPMAYMRMKACRRICIASIRIRMMRLMSDSVYAYAYGRLYIYEIDQSINKSF